MGILFIWVIFLAILVYWMITKKPFLRKKRYKSRFQRMERNKEIDQIGKE